MKKYRGLSITLIIGVLLFGCAQSLSKDLLLSNQGLQEISKENYPQAEKYLNQALELNPNNPYALLNMGVVYQKMGQPERARLMYERVISINPKVEAGHSNQDSGVGKTLVDMARGNLRLLDSEKIEKTVSKKTPSRKRPTVRSARKRPAVFQSERKRQPVTKKVTSRTKAGSLSLGPNGASMWSAENLRVRYYKVQKNDTLFKIAGRKEVYGDPLKWPSLYRLNLDKLGGMKLTENFQHQELRRRFGLKFVTQRRVAKNLTRLNGRRWVVNVLSAQNFENVVQPSLMLMKKGYHVYIRKAKVKGEDWMRLRVGFFRDDRKAAFEKKKIMSMLHLENGSWVVKVSEDELRKFGGYY